MISRFVQTIEFIIWQRYRTCALFDGIKFGTRVWMLNMENIKDCFAFVFACQSKHTKII